MMGRTEPSACSCSRVAPKPSRLESQWRRKRRVVGDGLKVGVDEHQWLSKFVEDGADGGFHGGGEVEGGVLLE